MNTVSPHPAHPRWCAGAPTCTAERGGLGAAHRSEPVTFTAPTITVELTLFRTEPGWQTDTFLTATISDGTAGTVEAGLMMSVDDTWRFTDTLTGLLERVR